MEDFHSKLKYTIIKTLVILLASTSFDKLVELAVHLSLTQYTLCKTVENQNHSNLFFHGKLLSLQLKNSPLFSQ